MAEAGAHPMSNFRAFPVYTQNMAVNKGSGQDLHVFFKRNVCMYLYRIMPNKKISVFRVT